MGAYYSTAYVIAREKIAQERKRSKIAAMEAEPSSNLNESSQSIAEPTLSAAQANAEPYSSVETPTNSVEQRKGAWLFTRDNAKEMSAKAHRAKAERLERLRLASEPQRQSDEQYKLGRLARVRKQLEKLDSLLDAEIDPQKLDRLASAQARLSEQERLLSGRPLPGSHRPSKQSSPKPSSIEPSE